MEQFIKTSYEKIKKSKKSPKNFFVIENGGNYNLSKSDMGSIGNLHDIFHGLRKTEPIVTLDSEMKEEIKSLKKNLCDTNEKLEKALQDNASLAKTISSIKQSMEWMEKKMENKIKSLDDYAIKLRDEISDFEKDTYSRFRTVDEKLYRSHPSNRISDW